MPYLFPNEDVFVVLISLIIAGVLFVRWFRVQARRK
jgi:hypothetical protein